MKLTDIKDFKDIKPIGFGPNILNYNPKYKGFKSGIFLYSHKIYMHTFYPLFVLPSIKKKYVNSISNAIRMGFRFIDFSAAYGHQDLLGKAFVNSGINRNDLFVTTRVTNKAQLQHKVREQFFNSLKELGLDYVDLLQFHWPVTGVYLDTWREMEKLYEEGYVKHLGVANCHQHHLEEIFKICKYRPEIGQFEIHPLFTQKALVKFYKDNDIVIEAYTPVARCDDRLMNSTILKSIAKKYNKTVIQVVLRWHVQNEIVPVVRAMSLQHQKENYDIFDFELTEDEMTRIDSININSRLRYDPDNCDFSVL